MRWDIGVIQLVLEQTVDVVVEVHGDVVRDVAKKLSAQQQFLVTLLCAFSSQTSLHFAPSKG